MPNFTYIHLHSDFSNGVTSIDSITKYDEYIEAAKELGMTAMAFTEHGSVFSWVNKKQHIEAAGMKYIHGEEFYVTETLTEKIRDNYHCCLYARNFDGVLELNKLSSIAFNRQDGHYYYNPRISIDELISTSDNIIISTACLGGILNSGTSTIKDKFITFLAQNKHRCFLEVQHHNVEEQKRYNKTLYKMSQSLGIPLIAGTDTHALNDLHMKGREVLQKAKNVRFSNEDAWDLTFKDYDGLVNAYKEQNALPLDVVGEAIENTNKLADMVEEFALDKSYKYPHLWNNPEEIFRNKINEGIKERGADKYPNYQEYLDRIEYEMKAYKHNGAIDFMLLMEDILSWCRQNDILVGYGRGSVNGSVIAYLLGITEMDSIKHKLNFERFMNTERVSLSDIDTDFPPSRIDDVKQYIFSKTGLYCCDIVTFNTISDKGAINDVARALNIPLAESRRISDSVGNKEDNAKFRRKYPELFDYVELVKGTIVSVGSHPCGCVVAERTLDDHMGLFTTSTSQYPVSQIYMKEIDGLNYVKLDLLKLDTIEIINDTCKLAGIERLTPDNVDINDIAVWNSMRDDTTQIFQWEGHMGNDYIKKLLSDENIKKFQAVDENVDRMTLLSIGNSAIRPAGASYREDLANGVVRKSGSKVIDDFLKPTFGYLVFQCQIIDFLHQYCGFTMGEADIVRRCVDSDSRILMADDTTKAIKDIQVGDIVKTFDERRYEITTNKVVEVYDNHVQYTIKIIATNGHEKTELNLTAEHLVYSLYGWRKAKDLGFDSVIAVYNENTKTWEWRVIEQIYKDRFAHVYDLQIEKNHNYIANHFVVHNCFAKKIGTEAVIPTIKDGGYLTNTDGTIKKEHYIKGFIQTMHEKYGMKKEEAETTIVDFLQVISDASNYLFSLNHSQPYSYEGYVSGWLRYYYPLEFLTISLNVNKDKSEKTTALVQYAKKMNIKIKSPKFRHSKGGYFCDKDLNCIYQGIESIKYMNAVVPRELYSLKNNTYKSFVHLLADLKRLKIPIDARQLEILVKIDFFEEFGDISQLLYCIKLFDALWGKVSIKKNKIKELGVPEEIFRKYSLDEKQTRVEEIDCLGYVESLGYTDVEAVDLLKDCRKSAKNMDYSTKKVVKKFNPSTDDMVRFATKTVQGSYSRFSIVDIVVESANLYDVKCTLAEKLSYQLQYLGYVDYINESFDWRYIVITNLHAKYSLRFDAYCLNNGKTEAMKIYKDKPRGNPAVKNYYRKTSIKDGDIIYIKNCKKEPKRIKTDSGWWESPNIKEWWITDYSVYEYAPEMEVSTT